MKAAVPFVDTAAATTTTTSYGSYVSSCGLVNDLHTLTSTSSSAQYQGSPLPELTPDDEAEFLEAILGIGSETTSRPFICWLHTSQFEEASQSFKDLLTVAFDNYTHGFSPRKDKYRKPRKPYSISIIGDSAISRTFNVELYEDNNNEYPEVAFLCEFSAYEPTEGSLSVVGKKTQMKLFRSWGDMFKIKAIVKNALFLLPATEGKDLSADTSEDHIFSTLAVNNRVSSDEEEDGGHTANGWSFMGAKK